MGVLNFSQRLKDIAVHTKYSKEGSLRENFQVGFALPVWGDGKNTPTKPTKKFVEELFNQGLVTKPVSPDDAVTMMWEKIDPKTGDPMFNENTYLDSEQIKAMFGTISRQTRKRSNSGSKKPDLLSETSLVGIDFDDVDNGRESKCWRMRC